MLQAYLQRSNLNVNVGAFEGVNFGFLHSNVTLFWDFLTDTMVASFESRRTFAVIVANCVKAILSEICVTVLVEVRVKYHY